MKKLKRMPCLQRPSMRFPVLLLFMLCVVCYPSQADDFANARWIGAISKGNAHIPEGRTFSGSELKNPEVKAAWAKADSLSRQSICLKKTFVAKKKVSKATVCICGLGFYELSLNRKHVDEETVLAPLWSDYDKTVYYNVLDVTPLIRKGKNDISVLLGNGFYNEQGGRYHKMKISFGPPTLLFRLFIEYEDGKSEEVVSDSSWQYSLSPITFNSIYGGEDYDARIDRQQWLPVVVQEAPRGVLRKQIASPVKIMEHFGIQREVARHASSVVYDMGQNLAGFPQITVRGKCGQTVKITIGETLTDDLHVNQKQTGRPHYYVYTLSGKGDETWHPRFSYYGFRYAEVETEAELKDLQSCFIYNAAQKTGTFECSNQLLNDTYRIIDRAVRSNWQGVWTDCPHREKLGWLEQDWLNGEGLLHTYDCKAMIEQTMQNIADAQHDDGAVPTTAPQYTVFPGETWGKPFNESPEWGGAFIALPLLYYHHYGDDRLIRRYWEPMKRYVDYLSTQAQDNLLEQGLGDWYDYAEGKAGFARNTSVRFVSSAHYFQWNAAMAIMADFIDKEADRDHYWHQADTIRAAINRTFCRDHCYDTGSQCAQAIALDMLLTAREDHPKVMRRLIDDIHAHGDRLTTGDVGNRYLFRVLANDCPEGRSCGNCREHQELLYKMLNHHEAPGYGLQISQGMTTLTEQWNPAYGSSLNHFMMAHIANLLIPRFLGIEVMEGDAMEGRPAIRIAPLPVGDLTWCRGSAASSTGLVSSSWRIENGRFLLDFELPRGMRAVVTLPFSKEQHVVGEGSHHYEETCK